MHPHGSIPLPFLRHGRGQGEQGLGIVGLRCLVEVFGRTDLFDLAIAQDGGVISHLPDYGQVMAYKEDREAEFCLQIFKQIQDFCLDRDVQG